VLAIAALQQAGAVLSLRVRWKTKKKSAMAPFL
jgi:hypothetical protein